MPHVIVKLWPGKSEQQKARLAEKITKDVMDVLDYGEESVSVAIEEVEPEDWARLLGKMGVAVAANNPLGSIEDRQPIVERFENVLVELLHPAELFRL